MEINLYDNQISDIINGLSDVIRNDYISDNNNLQLYVGKEIIKSIDNKKYQVIYGRRGTGKTHLLKAYKEMLLNNFKQDKIYPIYIDLRRFLPVISNVNQNYVESAIIIFMNIVREIVDVLVRDVNFICDINKFNKLFFKDERKINSLKCLLKQFQYDFDGKAFEKVSEFDLSTEDVEKLEGNMKIGIGKDSKFESGINGQYQYTEKQNSKNIRYITFSNISKYIPQLLSILEIERIVCILDEWSEVKLDVQVFLSDLIKKAFITNPFTFKIAAIPNRTILGKMVDREYIGLEDGGDIFPFNLDNRFIYELEQEQTKDFFNDLLYTHLLNIDKKIGFNILQNYSKGRFINLFFANKALREILIASAGIPRDFISLFINSYDKFLINTSNRNKRIGVRDIRLATIDWYKFDKEKQVNDIPNCKLLLREIINEIIIKKKKTHFLIPQKYSNNVYLNQLIDFRIIHLRKKGYSHKGNAGVVYDVYSIDYGCYISVDVEQSKLDIDLINKIDSIDNFREIRRVSLDDKFFDNLLLESGEGFLCPHCKKPVNINHMAYRKQKICNNCFDKIEE
ncbi:DnaA/Hda family protein [Clostridium perfringens]|uniref:DnaA ATPase domain-containing protein n=1 Tax=Clostridium perfringens TaxID=1502 RepID=UPI00234093FB|nr:DnaA/Hda family protein [Clostridium perfringens]MDC4251939.1 DnaA/Hda family protein [Clostridium perfringens]